MVKPAFNGLSPHDWVLLSKNVWDDVSSPREKKHMEHGATFPTKLAERLIKIYSGEGDLILDPFVGVGTTLEACAATNRSGIGIELNSKFYPYAAETASSKPERLKAVNDDCRNLLNHVQPETVQLMVTSPPYADFIQKSVKDRATTHKDSIIAVDNNSVVKQYSEASEDFGNLSYEEFLAETKKLMEKVYTATIPGGYSAWIVKDARDTKNKVPYVPFHSDFGNIGQEAGFKYHDLIIWNQNAQRRLVLLGFPSVFYTNQNCSFIVILRKPKRM